MKTTATLIQQALEQKAIDSMIAYERNLISEQKMGRALNDALQHYGNVEGHRSIVLKGWIIKTIYVFSCQRKTINLQNGRFRHYPILEYLNQTCNNSRAFFHLHFFYLKKDT